MSTGNYYRSDRYIMVAFVANLIGFLYFAMRASERRIAVGAKERH